MPARKATAATTTTAPPAREDENLSEDDLLSAAPRTTGAKATKKTSTAKSNSAAGTKRKAPTAGRQALKDRTNVQPVADLNNTQQEEHEAEERVTKRAKSENNSSSQTKATKRSVKTDEPQRKTQELQSIDETIEPVSQDAVPTGRAARGSSARPSPPVNSYRAASVRATSVQPSQRREGSVSATNTERAWRSGDADLHRQLTTMTRDCENMRLRNQALEDLVKTKAESNFEQLKREADEKTRRADELIASLKKEIAVLRKSWSTTSSETTSLQKQVKSLTTNAEQMAAENERLASESAQLRSSLQACEKERNAFEVKLMAAREQLNGGGATSNNRIVVSGSSSEAQREWRMKENLYTDLTGLIVRGVKRKDGEDEYDCIQTGRNGTLHFHLSVINETGANNPKTPSSYEEAEFSYEPFLDEDRDKELLEILPDYLSEDICFPRNHAVKFYTKVVESMTKKIVVEDGE